MKIFFIEFSLINKIFFFKVFIDMFSAIKAWRVWFYIGRQDIKNMFRRSKMGAGWLFINITLTSLGLGYIYGTLFHQNLKDFFIRILLSLSIWTFISGSIIQGCLAFIMSEGYIKQFSFVKQIYSLRLFVPLILNLFIGFMVCFFMSLIFSIPMYFPFLPFMVGLILFTLVGLGHVLLMPYWGTKYRDLSPALGGLFQIIFYITPIIFTPDMLLSRGLGFIYIYNPFYYLIEIVRYPILNGAFAPIEIYKYCFTYLLIIWLLYAIVAYRNDSRITYWL